MVARLGLSEEHVSENTLVIYHGGCFDGFTAAWAFRKLRPDVATTFRPAHHGERPPNVVGRDVYVLDFAYPRATMLEMAEGAARILVLDHHKTARDDLDGLPFCQFDMERSGAGIAWDYFAQGAQPRPWIVDIVEDRDLWRFRFGDETRWAMAYISSLPMTFESWDALVEAGLEQAVERGKAVQQYIDAYGEAACAHALFRDIGGHTVPVINIPNMNCSEHIDRLRTKYPDYPFAASFFLRADGVWQFSLRSAGSFDVSTIARAFGGGGHRNASGFQSRVLPWDMERQPTSESEDATEG